MLGLGFAAGAIPFSGLAARMVAGVDLRRVGSGTVSGTGLYDVSGFGPLAVAGSLEVAVGAVGPILAGARRPVLGSLAAALGVCGHNWSPLLGGAGGRGISTVLGAGLALCPEATLVVGTSFGAGRLVRQSGLGCFVGLTALFPVLWRRRGPTGLLMAACLALPVMVKRVMGNGSAPRGVRSVLERLVFDRDRDRLAMAAPIGSAQ